MEEGDLGSLIALPLQGEAVREGNSVFVNDRFETLPDQCAFLHTLPKASADDIAKLADEFGKDPIGLPEGTSRRITPIKLEAPVTKESTDNALQETPSVARVTLADGVRIDCNGLPRALSTACET